MLTPYPRARTSNVLVCSWREARFRGRRPWLRGAALSLLWACSTNEVELPPRRTEAPNAAPSPARPGPASSPTRARHATKLRIPEGAFLAGTRPGRHDRQPELEPALESITLGAFEIDAAPYPGGAEPALLGAPRERALRLCRERGGRLCSELEWERACKGPASSPFSNGSSFDPSCAASGCPSGFDVRGLGYAREWTSSELDGSSELRAMVRGASSSAAPAQHRCAHRSAVAPSSGEEIAFRCCYGAPNAARITAPVLGATYEKLELPVGELAELLRADPLTRELSKDLSYFDGSQAADAVRRKGPGESQGFLLTAVPLLWRPVAGATFLVLAARSGADTSFVVVYHTFGDGQRALESSFIMRGEPGPVALAYNGYIRPRLHFSTCWGCPGETGKILYRDPDHAVILQP